MYLATPRTLGRVIAPWTLSHYYSAGAVRSISVAGKGKAGDKTDTNSRRVWKRWTVQEKEALSRLMASGVRVVDMVASLPGRSQTAVYEMIWRTVARSSIDTAFTEDLQALDYRRSHRHFCWTEEEKRRMKELRAGGWSWSRITQEIGRGACLAAVRKACIQRYGDPLSSKRLTPWSPDESALLESLRSQGLTPRAIQEHLPHRSLKACGTHAFRMDIRRAAGGSFKRSRWQQSEIDKLREGIQRGLSISQLAIKLQRPTPSIWSKASSLSLLPRARDSKNPICKVHKSISGERSKTTTVESSQQVPSSEIATAPKGKLFLINDLKRPKMVNGNGAMLSTTAPRPYSTRQIRKLFTPEEDSIVRQLSGQNMTVAAIAEKLGRSRDSIYARARLIEKKSSPGRQQTKRKGHFTPEEDFIIRELAEQNMTAAAIAEKLGRPRGAIYARARKIEIKPSPDPSFYSEHEDQLLRELRARKVRIADIASKMQRPICSIQRRIGILGLRKRWGGRDLNRTCGPSPGTIARKRPLSDEELEEIRHLRSNGALFSSIAPRFHLSVTRITEICHEKGFSKPSNTPPWTYEDDTLICQLLLARHTWEEIAARLGRRTIAIKKRAHYRGIGKKLSLAEILLAARTVYLKNVLGQPLDKIAVAVKRKKTFLRNKLSGWWQEIFNPLVEEEDPHNWSKNRLAQIHDKVPQMLLARFESPASDAPSLNSVPPAAGV